jgi:hypothetical protein
VFPENYRTTAGSKIVQVNLAGKKGGAFFWKLVERLPQREFLAVKGKEAQVLPEVIPTNCEVLENGPNMRDRVYAQAKVVIMPSQGAKPSEKWVPEGQAGHGWTESWGRVPIEAAASGIPSIVFPTPGLTESLGNSGRFLSFDIDMWVEEINRLYLEPDYYRQRSLLALQRSDELNPRSQFLKLEKLLISLHGKLGKKKHKKKAKKKGNGFEQTENGASSFASSMDYNGTIPVLQKFQAVLDRVRLRREEKIIRSSNLFDETWYLSRYQDVATADLDPVNHYLRWGAHEGRDPGPHFQTKRYIMDHPELVGERVNPLVHHIKRSR